MDIMYARTSGGGSGLAVSRSDGEWTPTTTTNYVTAGVKTDVTEVGGTWSSGSGYIEQGGTNKWLFCGDSGVVVTDNFDFYSDMTVDDANASDAATVTFTSDDTDEEFQCGITGGGGAVFFFAESSGSTWGGSTTYVETSTVISDNVRFISKVSRRGSTITWTVDSTVIFERSAVDHSLKEVGLRPWRSNMRCYDMYIDT